MPLAELAEAIHRRDVIDWPELARELPELAARAVGVHTCSTW
jgi:hypothetical protein